MKRLFILCAITVLSGCVGSPNLYSQSNTVEAKKESASALAMSVQNARLLQKLPADADLENLPKQLELIEQGHYLDKSGIRQSLSRAPLTSSPPVVKFTARTRPTTTAKREARTSDTIEFDPIPEAIDITQGAQ